MRSLFLLAVALSGCVHTQHLNPVIVSDFSRINDLGGRHTAGVRFHDQREFKVRYLEVDSDSTFWVDAASGDSVRVSTLEIEEIWFTNRSLGAAQGLLLTAAPVAALNLQAEVRNQNFDLGLGNSVFRTTVFFGAVGAGMGAVVGQKTRFRFPLVRFTE